MSDDLPPEEVNPMRAMLVKLLSGHLKQKDERIAALEAELASIDTALDSVTKCQAPTRADRITDSFLHTELVTDAAVFDAVKAEQSVRAQCTYWMQMVRAAGSRIESLEAENRLLRTPDQTMRHELASLRGENQSLREQLATLRATDPERAADAHAYNARLVRYRRALEQINEHGCTETYLRMTCRERVPDAGSTWCAGCVAGKALEEA